MKYCLKYNLLDNNWRLADEVAIKYIEDKGLVNFLELLKDKRIVLLVPEDFPETEIKKLIAIKKTYPQYNFVVSLFRYNEAIASTCRANNIPFFEEVPCYSWEKFNFLAQKGVSDIVIGGDLGFSLPRVKKLVDKKYPNLRLRAIANWSTTEITETDSLKGFFIRPEDVVLYSEYIDTIEFLGSTNQDVLYDIYTKGFFMGQLNQIILGTTETINLQDIPKNFGEKRISCGRKCLKDEHCDFCHLIITLTQYKNKKRNKKELD